MRRAQAKIFVSFLCLICAAIAFAAQERETELKPVGCCSVQERSCVRSAARRRETRFRTSEDPFVPDATLGSLSVTPNDPGTSLEELVAYRYDAHETRLANSVDEVLQANPGKVVSSSMGWKGLHGRDRRIKADEKEAPATSESEAVRLQPPPTRQFLLLHVEGKLMTFPLSGVGGIAPGGHRFPGSAHRSRGHCA